MAKVSLNINGRRYALGCDDGEEERLMRLGQKLDDRISTLANQFGQIGDLRLLVMAGITMMDELEEARQEGEAEAAKMTADIRRESETRIAAAQRDTQHATSSLSQAADQIEKLAARLSSSPE